MTKLPRDPRRQNGHRRRQLRDRLIATTTICEVCGEPLHKDLPAHHALASEVDEIIPVAAGGNPLSASNTRLIHSRCNVKEWQQWRRRAAARRRIPFPPLGSPRTWT